MSLRNRIMGVASDASQCGLWVAGAGHRDPRHANIPGDGVAGAPLHERSAQRFTASRANGGYADGAFAVDPDSAARSRLSSLRTIVDLGAALRKSVGAVHLTRGG